MTNTKTFSEGLVCIDCGQAIANGPDSIGEPAEGWRVAYDRECREMARLGVDVVNGDEADDHTFSRSRCDLCRSPLGGARMAVLFSWDARNYA